MAGKLQPLEPKFWAKVDKSGDCWLWIGSKNPTGYGQIRHNHKMYLAHRLPVVDFDLESLHPSMKMDHKCHTPACVRPTHIQIGTQKQNLENLKGAHKDNPSGIRGVSWCKKRKKWRARVGHNYKEHIAGYFDTPEEAGASARELRLELFSFNTKDRESEID